MKLSIITLALVAVLTDARAVQKRYTNALIRSGRTNTCLTLQGGVQVIDGSLLRVGDCATATRWNINPGSGSVIVSGLNFALDAGVPQANNNPAKVWTSYPGSPQQTWYLTNDNRIAVTGGNQCLDEGDNGPQTYQCTPGNTNQVWYVDSGPTPSSSASASSTPSNPAGPRTQLHWQRNPSLCATAQSAAGNGVLVNMQNCVNPSSPGAGSQLFTFVGGNLQLVGTNFCLDAGTNPSNGVQMKLWQCFQGLSQQTFAVSGGLFRTANNQCLDVDNSNFSTLQTWTCSAPDPQQQFSLS